MHRLSISITKSVLSDSLDTTSEKFSIEIMGEMCCFRDSDYCHPIIDRKLVIEVNDTLRLIVALKSRAQRFV